MCAIWKCLDQVWTLCEKGNRSFHDVMFYFVFWFSMKTHSCWFKHTKLLHNRNPTIWFDLANVALPDRFQMISLYSWIRLAIAFVMFAIRVLAKCVHRFGLIEIEWRKCFCREFEGLSQWMNHERRNTILGNNINRNTQNNTAEKLRNNH